MQKDMIDSISKNTEGAMEAAKRLGELNLRTMDRLMQQQNEMMGLYMEIATRSFDLLGKAKGVQDLAKGQAELSREFGERSMEVLRKGMDLANEAGAEYGALVKEGVQSAQAQVAEATKNMKMAA